MGKEAREKIEKNLMKGIDAYSENLQQLHKFYVSHFKQYYSYVVSDPAVVAKKTAEYEAELAAMHKRALADYEKMLKSTSTKHMIQFEAFFVSAFGAAPTNKLIISLKTHYKECIEKKVAEVLKKFDDWWIIWEPKLIEHYCCGFKCKVKFVTPQLHLNFEWRFCPASLRSCVFYC